MLFTSSSVIFVTWTENTEDMEICDKNMSNQSLTILVRTNTGAKTDVKVDWILLKNLQKALLSKVV